jgi:Dihaem cytochrome c
MAQNWKRWMLSGGVALGVSTLGLGYTRALAQSKSLEGGVKTEEATPEPILEKYQLSAELYSKNCSSCHVPIPPQVFPSDTWQQLLTQPEHYGVSLKQMRGPELKLIYLYLKDYSRGVKEKEAVPLYFSESRYFKALHPKVDLPDPVDTASCLECHPSARQNNYRVLSESYLKTEAGGK